MAKPEWGQKRSCLSCGVRFYDLQRSPIVCPKCNAEFDPGQAAKARRAKAPVAAKAAAKAIPKPVPEQDKAEAEPPSDDDDAVGAVEGDSSGDGEAVLEDTSELGEADDEVSEVRAPRPNVEGRE